MVIQQKMTSQAYQDEAIILKVKDWQTADKYAVCFSRAHGKVAFIAYGARYARTTGGRLIQPFALLNLQVYAGKRLDSLKNCELLEQPQQLDIKQIAYGAVIAEVTENLTEEQQPQEEIYLVLVQAIKLLNKNNPRLVALAFICKLLTLSGVAPIYDVCVNCGKAAEAEAYFSVVQGGLICNDCSGGEELAFGMATQELFIQLLHLDMDSPQPFKVKGAELMELEQLLYRFIVYQTDKPLKSLSFLAQLGV